MPSSAHVFSGTVVASVEELSRGGPGVELESAKKEEEEEDDGDEEAESGSKEGSEGSYCSGSSCCGRARGEDRDEDEKVHFLDVCYSLLDYSNDTQRELERLQEGLAVLEPFDAELWQGEPSSWLAEITRCAQVNAAFLARLPSPEVCGADLGEQGERRVQQIPDGHRVTSRNSSKVGSTLRQFVRDWAREGEAERRASYGPLIEALHRHLPVVKGKAAPRVLCPGCGLGRLPFDLAALGYAAQGNEFSYHMLLGSHLVLNRCVMAESFEIFPFVLSTTNRRGASDHLRPIRVPDVCPRTQLRHDAELSMAAGEFIEVYKDQIEEWDAVASAFFLDTAKNIFLYIRIIASVIRRGGLLINIGPLLYHYADVEREISIELSWEEVRPAICRYFDIVEEENRVARYTTNPGSLMGVKYRCKFFVAVRNGEPVTGSSHPVF